MSSCCNPDEYGKMFRPREAKRAVARYLKRGLTGTAEQLADAVSTQGLDGATVLEVGGGAGTLHAELLRRGAARAVNVELSPSWEEPALRLLGDLGLADLVERRVGDFVVEAPELDDADIVVMHRVVCCYPDWKQMLAAGSRLARRSMALTFPVDRLRTRLVIGVANLGLRLLRRDFRAFVHPEEAMLSELAEEGFEVNFDRSALTWRTVILTRPAAV